MHHAACRSLRIGALLLVCPNAIALAQEKPPAAALAPGLASALDRISADSLKGHLSFLASDLLEGRDTPSKGLDLAAEYIAAQFRRAGLESVGDDGYFQTGDWERYEQPRDSFSFELVGEGPPIKLSPDDVILTGTRVFQVEAAPLFKVDFKSYASLNREDLAGKVLLVEFPARRGSPEERDAIGRSTGIFGTWASAAKVAAVIGFSRVPRPDLGIDHVYLSDPKNPEAPMELDRRYAPGRMTMITIQNRDLIKLFDTHTVGPIAAKVTTRIGAPERRQVKLRNVAGLLRGSDPTLKDTCVMATAHYDHIGAKGAEGTDRIYNGANDDGSGTVSVIEIASALASLKERPKRSLLFVTFFGEEKGLLGSRYYGRNPLFSVEKTVADVNLEQVGRTDDSEGPQVNRASLTGFGYSGVSAAFVAAGRLEGVEVFKHSRHSDAFFGRSDNQALADLGVPAHTLCVAFQFADYHGAADHWDKVDYANMARIDRMVARALVALADDVEEPKWDESNPKAAKYLKAWKDRRAK